MRNTVFFAGQPEHAVRFGSKKTIHVDATEQVASRKIIACMCDFLQVAV